LSTGSSWSWLDRFWFELYYLELILIIYSNFMILSYHIIVNSCLFVCLFILRHFWFWCLC
jgi:hypothetical protein